MVSEWRSVIAVSLNVGGDVRLIKPAKLCMCMQNTTNTTRTDARRRVCAQWFRTAEPLGERRYEVVTRIGIHTHTVIMVTPVLRFTIIYVLLFADWLQFIAFRDKEIFIHQFVHVYFCIKLCLFERSSSPGNAMMLA